MIPLQGIVHASEEKPVPVRESILVPKNGLRKEAGMQTR
jgi:hypothetical protein